MRARKERCGQERDESGKRMKVEGLNERSKLRKKRNGVGAVHGRRPPQPCAHSNFPELSRSNSVRQFPPPQPGRAAWKEKLSSHALLVSGGTYTVSPEAPGLLAGVQVKLKQRSPGLFPRISVLHEFGDGCF